MSIRPWCLAIACTVVGQPLAVAADPGAERPDWARLDLPAVPSLAQDLAPRSAGAQALLWGTSTYAYFPDRAGVAFDLDAWQQWLVGAQQVGTDTVTRLPLDTSPADLLTAAQSASVSRGTRDPLWVVVSGYAASLPQGPVLLGTQAASVADALPLRDLWAVLPDQAVVVLDLTWLDAEGERARPGDVVAWRARPDDLTVLSSLPGGDDRLGPASAWTYLWTGALSGWADGFDGARDGRVQLEEARAFVSSRLASDGAAPPSAVMRGRGPLARAQAVWTPAVPMGAGPTRAALAAAWQGPVRHPLVTRSEVQRDGAVSAAQRHAREAAESKRPPMPTGTPTAEERAALAAWVDAWDDATVEVDGVRYPVVPAGLAAAQDVLLGAAGWPTRTAPAVATPAVWADMVATLLVQRHDADGSGSLDWVSELQDVPCRTWQALDGAAVHHVDEGLWAYAGGPSTPYAGQALGLGLGLEGPFRQVLAACGLGTASATHSNDAPSTREEAPAWLQGQLQTWLDAVDTDGSGAFDRGAEIAAVPCAALESTDAVLRRAVRTDLYALLTSRHALGSHTRVARAALAARTTACGLPGATDTTTPVEEALVGSLLSFGDPGSTRWDKAVKRALVARHDLDGDGVVLARVERDSIDCAVWSALDAAVRTRFVHGLATAYGLDLRDRKTTWLGNLLGLGALPDTGPASALRACGLLNDQRSVDAEADGRSALPVPLVAVIGPLSDPGSDGWDRSVRDAVLQRHDTDGSGRLDTQAELTAVPCEAWQAMDAALLPAWFAGLRELYGIDAGEGWRATTLGVDRALAEALRARLDACALPQTQASAADPWTERISRVASYREAVEMLRVVLDVDEDGQISAGEQLGAACRTWWGVHGLDPDAGPADRSLAWFAVQDRCGLPVSDGGQLASRGVKPSAAGFLATTDHVRDPAAAISALPDGGSAEWDEGVRAILLHAFDSDGSGVLDSPGEVASLACPVWAAVEQGVRDGWGSSFYVVYGVDPSLSWVGDALGISERMRRVVGKALASCDMVTPLSSESQWADAIWQVALSPSDADGNGRLDTTQEVLAVPCAAWDSVQMAMREAGLGRLTQVPWSTSVRDALRVEATLEGILRARLQRCEGDDGSASGSGTSVAPQLVALNDPGSSTWEDGVTALLVSAFDADGSGRIDQAAEVAAIDCAAWAALRDAARQGWGAPLQEAYGLGRGSAWLGYRLGLEQAVRSDVLTALDGCSADISTEVAAAQGDAVAASLAGLSGERLAVEQGIRRTLTAAYDRDGDLWVDRTEVRAMPCVVLRSLDKAARDLHGVGVVEAYVLSDEPAAMGAVALSGDPRALGRTLGAKVRRCERSAP